MLLCKKIYKILTLKLAIIIVILLLLQIKYKLWTDSIQILRLPFLKKYF
jgi:hypothetical protein